MLLFVFSLAQSVVITKPFVFHHASSVCNDLYNSLPITDVSLSSLIQLFSSRTYLAVVCRYASARGNNIERIRSVHRLLARHSILVVAMEVHNIKVCVVVWIPRYSIIDIVIVA